MELSAIFKHLGLVINSHLIIVMWDGTYVNNKISGQQDANSIPKV